MELQRSNDLLRTIIKAAPVAIIGLDLDGNIQMVWNPAAEKMLGWKSEEVMGKPLPSVPLEHQDEFKHFRELIRSGKALEGVEVRRQRRDGSPIEYSIYASPLHDVQGGIIGNVAVLVDITERKQMEYALTVQEREYRTLLENIPDLIVRYNTDLCRIYVNPAWEKTSGLSSDEVVNKPITDIPNAPVPVNDDYVNIIQQVLETGTPQTIEFSRKNAHGALLQLEYTIVPEYDNAGHIGSMLAVGHDLTERKQAEEALHVSEERLHQAIRVSQTGIFDHDHLTNTIYWSPEQRAIYGIGADETITLEVFLKQVYPEDRDRIAEAVQRAHDPKCNGSFDVQHRIIRRDGEVRWLMTRSKTFFDEADEERRPVRTIGAVMDITERMRTEEKVAYLAFYDSLTGLANRRLLRDRLDRSLAVSERKQLYGALLFIDLDQFKTLNDTVGHDYGDMLLKEVARRLHEILRDMDTVSRPGGDEFVVILEEIGTDAEKAASHAKTVSDKILEALARPYYLRDKDYTGSASIGVALFHGHDDNIDELLKRSDMAMYEAKRAGRGVVRFFDPVMQAAFEKRARLENDIRKALELKQFMLYYQVRVGNDGRALGAEALLRWSHQERGIVMPAEFISVCEETGLILTIGEWVLEAACAQLRMWQDHPAMQGLKISVNISANQFRQSDFVDRVIGVIETTGIDPTHLELELTESMFLENIEHSIAKMRILRDIGVLFALDDFGTGYSSLSYLKRLPLSQIKIDRSFVRDITKDKNDETIIQTIIKMGQTLGLEVIAEGVETEEQYNMLKQHGCRNFQGYLFGKPMPIAEFEQALIK